MFQMHGKTSKTQRNVKIREINTETLPLSTETRRLSTIYKTKEKLLNPPTLPAVGVLESIVSPPTRGNRAWNLVGGEMSTH